MRLKLMDLIFIINGRDDAIIWAFVCAYPTAQIQQQHNKDKASQKLYLYNCDFLDPRNTHNDINIYYPTKSFRWMDST